MAPPARERTRLSAINWRISTHAAGAHGEADRDLLLPADGAREQQVGHVGAGDQQQQPDDAEQDEQRIGELVAQIGNALAGGHEDQRLGGERRCGCAPERNFMDLHLHDEQAVIVGFQAGLRLARA